MRLQLAAADDALEGLEAAAVAEGGMGQVHHILDSLGGLGVIYIVALIVVLVGARENVGLCKTARLLNTMTE